MVVKSWLGTGMGNVDQPGWESGWKAHSPDLAPSFAMTAAEESTHH